MPVAIALMSGASAHELPWGRIMAASVVVSVPVVLLVLALQRRIVAGLTAGAIKGERRGDSRAAKARRVARRDSSRRMGIHIASELRPIAAQHISYIPEAA